MKFLAFGTFAAIVWTYIKLKEISKEIMASKTELLAILDRVVAAQANIADDVRGLKDQLENAGVDQEIIDRAESIATSLEALAAETPEVEPEEPTEPEQPEQ